MSAAKGTRPGCSAILNRQRVGLDVSSVPKPKAEKLGCDDIIERPRMWWSHGTSDTVPSGASVWHRELALVTAGLATYGFFALIEVHDRWTVLR